MPDGVAVHILCDSCLLCSLLHNLLGASDMDMPSLSSGEHPRIMSIISMAVLFNMLAKAFLNLSRNHKHPVLAAFSLPHPAKAPADLDILFLQRHKLADPEASRVHQLNHKPVSRIANCPYEQFH